jgi:hypothetical protein
LLATSASIAAAKASAFLWEKMKAGRGSIAWIDHRDGSPIKT